MDINWECSIPENLWGSKAPFTYLHLSLWWLRFPEFCYQCKLLVWCSTLSASYESRIYDELSRCGLVFYLPLLIAFSLYRYVVVYFSILYIRHRAGVVTKEMLSLPRAPYLVVGLLEALAGVSGMAATSKANLLFCSLFLLLSQTSSFSRSCIHTKSSCGLFFIGCYHCKCHDP